MKTKIFALVLCFALLAISLFSCAGKSDNPYGLSEKEMSEVRTFTAHESGAPEGNYSIIKQDGYGKIYEWTSYDADGKVTTTSEYEYDGIVITKITIRDAQGNEILCLADTLDENGKIITRNVYLNGELGQTQFFKDDNGQEIPAEEAGVVYVKYDELGRICSSRQLNGDGTESLTLTEFGPLGLVSEINYLDGEEVHRIELKEQAE